MPFQPGNQNALLLHSNHSKHPHLFFFAPFVSKQVFGEDEFLNAYCHLVITGIHLQPGGEGGAEGRHIDTTVEAATGSVHLAGDWLG